jgi:hypothetical protein
VAAEITRAAAIAVAHIEAFSAAAAFVPRARAVRLEIGMEGP